MQKIKVLNFVISSTFGGIETYMYGVYETIDKNSIQMDFVASYENAETVKKFRELGAKVHIVSSPKNIIRYKKDIDSILQDGYDIAYFNKNSAANIIPVKIAKKNNCKIIVHSHNVIPSQGRLTRYIHFINRKKIERLADKKLACSVEAGKWMFEETGNCEVIKNGIDTYRYEYSEHARAVVRKELKIDQDSMVVGCVGRFAESKNQRWIIENYHKISAGQNKKVVVVLVGDGSCLVECKALAESVADTADIIFTGARNDIQNILSAMDIFVMPSVDEGFGIVAIEAQASGVSTYISEAVPESAIVTDNVRRFTLTDKGADKIRRAIEQEEYVSGENRKKYSAAVANRGFDMRESYKRVEQIIKELYND